MWQYRYADELYHHGVKGMKWGVRRKNSQKSDLRRRLDSAKSDSKTASKTFSKSYGEAYGKRIDAVSPFKNRRAANKARWQKAESDYAKKKEARSTYKKLKEERKSKLKETYKKLDQNTSKKEKLWYDNTVRYKASKYVVDNNMTVKEANQRAKKEYNRNAVLSYVAVFSAVAVSSVYKANK